MRPHVVRPSGTALVVKAQPVRFIAVGEIPETISRKKDSPVGISLWLLRAQGQGAAQIFGETPACFNLTITAGRADSVA